MTESLRQRPGDQPLPTEGQESVQDALIAHIEKRKALGIQRYGRPLETFNGRNAPQDLLEELLDGATYAMQIAMEIAATQKRINEALAKHLTASTGRCSSCQVAAPCPTRRILTGQAEPETPVEITAIEPVEEVVCSPDAMDYMNDHFKFEPAGAEIGPSPTVGAYMGIPVYVDDQLPPRTVRLQPHSPKQ
jgi:hypothetical protein